MKRLVCCLALAAVMAACDDEDPPAPRDAGKDAVADGGPTGAADARADAPDGSELAEAGDGPGDLGGEGGIDAFTLPDAAAGEQLFVASLSGAEEGGGVTTTAVGAATFVLNAARTELRYQLRHNVANVKAGHLHLGWPGENGPVALAFPMPPGADISGTLSVTAAQAADVEAGHLYANLHSAVYAAGEIRGQLLRPGETIFVAALTGAQETPAVTTTASGTASLILDAARSSVRFRAITSGVAPVGVHIRKAMARVPGAIVYSLPTAAAVEGTQSLTPTDVKDLESGLWYIDFPSAANPNGELRGQLLAPGAKMFATTLTGSQEVPPVPSTLIGNGMAIVPYTRNQVQYHLTTTATPSNAHFHGAAAGVSGDVVIAIAPLGTSMSGVAPLTPELAQQMERGLLYMNIHTAANPGGELRGQVIAVDETLFTAVMTGAGATPLTTTAAGGLGVMLNAAGTQIRYVGSFTGLTAVEANLHAGAVGVTGPVVYPLTVTGNLIEGVQAMSTMDLAALTAGNWYVSVQSAANPAGEIRGQLLRR
jgi:hypothetical protein